MNIVKRSPPYRNGHRNAVLVEPLSARVFRLRIGLGYSVYELAEDSGVFAGTIKRLEAGKSVDKRELPALAAVLGVPFCQLLCGNHSCGERACVPGPLVAVPPQKAARDGAGNGVAGKD